MRRTTNGLVAVALACSLGASAQEPHSDAGEGAPSLRTRVLELEGSYKNVYRLVLFDDGFIVFQRTWDQRPFQNWFQAQLTPVVRAKVSALLARKDVHALRGRTNSNPAKTPSPATRFAELVGGRRARMPARKTGYHQGYEAGRSSCRH